METLIVNLYGGPGTGKSTAAAGIFHKLKLSGVNCEMALEYAKDKVWEDSYEVLHNQLYVFGKQFHRIWRLLDKVDIIVTDAPILNSILYYRDENPYFTEMVVFEHQRLNNFNVFLQRVKPFNPAGRVQNEGQSRALDTKIVGILDKWKEPYFTTPAAETSIDELVNMALRRFRQLNART